MKISKFLLGTCLATLFASCVCTAQSENWESRGIRMSIGMSYRSFSDIEFNAPNLVGAPGMLSSSGMKEDSAAARQDIINSDITSYPLAMASYVHGGKSEESIDGSDSLFPVIGFGYDLFNCDAMTFSLVSNLQFLDMDLSGKTSSRIYNATLKKSDSELNVTPMPIPGSQSNLKIKTDIQGLVWDLGLQMAYPVDNLDFTVAAGPSLNLISMDSDFQNSSSDVEKIVPGFYISAGVTYWIKPQYGIAFDLRYDKVFDEIETNYVNMDLDSFGGGLKFIYNF